MLFVSQLMYVIRWKEANGIKPQITIQYHKASVFSSSFESCSSGILHKEMEHSLAFNSYHTQLIELNCTETVQIFICLVTLLVNQIFDFRCWEEYVQTLLALLILHEIFLTIEMLPKPHFFIKFCLIVRNKKPFLHWKTHAELKSIYYLSRKITKKSKSRSTSWFHWNLCTLSLMQIVVAFAL